MARAADVEQLRKFAEAYLGDAAGNQAEAARLAGYKGSKKTLSTTAARLLKRPDVRAMLEDIERSREATGEQGAVMTPHEVQVWWSDTIKGRMRDTPVGNVVVKMPATMSERLRASHLLALSLKMLREDKHKPIDLTQVLIFTLPDDGRPVVDMTPTALPEKGAESGAVEDLSTTGPTDSVPREPG